MTPAETLRRAKAVLLERGWYQGDWCDKDKKCVCALGAIGTAVFGTPAGALDYPYYGGIRLPYNAAGEILGEVVGTQFIDDWNDAGDRTLPEVLAAFDKAIALAEGTQR